MLLKYNWYHISSWPHVNRTTVTAACIRPMFKQIVYMVGKKQLYFVGSSVQFYNCFSLSLGNVQLWRELVLFYSIVFIISEVSSSFTKKCKNISLNLWNCYCQSLYCTNYFCMIFFLIEGANKDIFKDIFCSHFIVTHW